MKALQILKKNIKELIEVLKLPKQGPYEMDIIPKLNIWYFNCQIHIIINLDNNNCNIKSWPENFDCSKTQYFFLLISKNHVVPILNWKKFLKTNYNFACFVKLAF